VLDQWRPEENEHGKGNGGGGSEGEGDEDVAIREAAREDTPPGQAQHPSQPQAAEG